MLTVNYILSFIDFSSIYAIILNTHFGKLTTRLSLGGITLLCGLFI